MKKNVLTVWAKRAIPALALAGLTLPSCEKENDKPIYRAPYEKELRFNETNDDSISVSNITKYLNDTACKHIYMVVMPDNNYTGFEAQNIEVLRKVLQQRIDLGNNISGRGDFLFRPGAASVNDSLWFVQNGWTILKNYYQR